ncbi:fimbria/pilus periplasmic chaperone [Morganella morganii]|uniref:fimbria/pilus periplasmic chaperone n=1 Tax=Morganella morganii TaxID=582 RepID=UPI001C451BC1|nr:fimbria/pilus periplasmic chaperone [Morganella morganii]QXO64987.1 fimbria/pilus periplasmic chaperone [Morganella morganii]
MMSVKHTRLFVPAIAAVLLASAQSHAAIALDRTRVIFNGAEKSVSLNVSNMNKELPYLAQGWIEDQNGQKVSSPLVVLPPVQRIEPGDKSQVKIQSLPAIAALPQDRESVFYFNLREIPPRSNRQNVLQIALQTRIKLFYRPQAIYASQTDLTNPWQEKITLTRRGDRYEVNNPTAYYVTIVDALSGLGGKSLDGFSPLMVAPKSQGTLGLSASALGSAPVLSYINDYGGRPQLQFSCSGTECRVTKTAAGN